MEKNNSVNMDEIIKKFEQEGYQSVGMLKREGCELEIPKELLDGINLEKGLVLKLVGVENPLLPTEDNLDAFLFYKERTGNDLKNRNNYLFTIPVSKYNGQHTMVALSKEFTGSDERILIGDGYGGYLIYFPIKESKYSVDNLCSPAVKQN